MTHVKVVNTPRYERLNVLFEEFEDALDSRGMKVRASVKLPNELGELVYCKAEAWKLLHVDNRGVRTPVASASLEVRIASAFRLTDLVAAIRVALSARDAQLDLAIEAAEKALRGIEEHHDT